jgi:hypothetical protein
MNIGSQHANTINNSSTTNNYHGGHRAEFDTAREALARVPLTSAQRDEVRGLLDDAAQQAGPNPAAAALAVTRAQDRLRFWGVVGTAGAGALTALGQIVTALAA